jgi:hypothetical protein
MKNFWRATAVTASVCAIYLTIVFGGRYLDRRASERAAKERFSPLPAELESPELKILQFYVSPPLVPPGGRALVCYGVLNAASVAIDPPVEDLKPALNRCFEIHPRATATYRLTATGKGGSQLTAEFELKVQ